MSNHGQFESDEQRRHFAKMFPKELGLGPTNQFPQGKIHKSDEGELKLAIGHKDGKVFLAFGTPTEWIGFDRQQTLMLVESLLKHAAECSKK